MLGKKAEKHVQGWSTKIKSLDSCRYEWENKR